MAVICTVHAPSSQKTKPFLTSGAGAPHLGQRFSSGLLLPHRPWHTPLRRAPLFQMLILDGWSNRVHEVCVPSTAHWLQTGVRKEKRLQMGGERGGDCRELRLPLVGVVGKQMRKDSVALISVTACSLYTEGAGATHLSQLFFPSSGKAALGYYLPHVTGSAKIQSLLLLVKD